MVGYEILFTLQNSFGIALEIWIERGRRGGQAASNHHQVAWPT